MLNITVEPNPNKVQFKERRGIDFEGSELKVGFIMKFRPLISFTVSEKDGQDSRDQLLEKKKKIEIRVDFELVGGSPLASLAPYPSDIPCCHRAAGSKSRYYIHPLEAKIRCWKDLGGKCQ